MSKERLETLLYNAIDYTYGVTPNAFACNDLLLGIGITKDELEELGFNVDDSFGIDPEV